MVQMGHEIKSGGLYLKARSTFAEELVGGSGYLVCLARMMRRAR